MIILSWLISISIKKCITWSIDRCWFSNGSYWCWFTCNRCRQKKLIPFNISNYYWFSQIVFLQCSHGATSSIIRSISAGAGANGAEMCGPVLVVVSKTTRIGAGSSGNAGAGGAGMNGCWIISARKIRIKNNVILSWLISFSIKKIYYVDHRQMRALQQLLLELVHLQSLPTKKNWFLLAFQIIIDFLKMISYYVRMELLLR